MQPVIEKIYQNTLSDAEKFKATFLEDINNEYYIYAWVTKDIILYLDYGKGEDYLVHKPDLPADDETATDTEIKVAFPYNELTEKEAYVLSRYEKIKMDKFGYEKITDIGVLT